MYTSYSQIVNDLQHNMTNFNDYIYLDHSATTPIHPEVYAAMEPFMTKQFGNASSLHTFGRQARNAIEIAREQVAKLINAKSDEIIFTSGATESNNLAINGFYIKNSNKESNIITSTIEHKAVLDKDELIQEENSHETKAKDTAEIKNKVKVDEEDVDSSKEPEQEESQTEAPKVKNEVESEKTEPEKPEAKSTQDKADADSKPESTDESEEVNKTKS
mgnify:CR=1 FL=1